jgi:AcrR family transcriptional regulator
VLWQDQEVSPKTPDPSVRTALLEAAARLVATEGRGALTLRRLAGEVGTSTMAIYTHFGGMDEVLREVRREGFARLGAFLGAVEETEDPVADVGALGWAYYRSAAANPNLYRAMFMDGPVDLDDFSTGLDTFVRLISAVERCIAAGRFRAADPAALATQLWALTHGLITLQFAHLLSEDQVLETMGETAGNLFRAWGDEPQAIAESRARTRKRATGRAGGRARSAR